MKLSRHLAGLPVKKEKKGEREQERERDVKRQIVSKIKKRKKGSVSSRSLICAGGGIASWQRYSRGSISISSNTDHLSSYAKIKLDKQPP